MQILNVDELLDGELITELEKAKTLRGTINDEKTPYKTLYEAADICKDLGAKLAAAQSALEPTHPRAAQLAESIALAACLRGLALAETDLLYDAREAFSTGADPLVKAAEALDPASLLPWGVLLLSTALEVCNAVGVLEMGREEPERARDMLQRGEALANAVLQGAGPALSDASLDASLAALALGDDTPAAAAPSAALRYQVRSLQTFTHFYLAQVFSALGDKDGSAAYICSTMALQLQTDQWTPNDWLSNAVGMAAFFLDQEQWASSLLLLHCGVRFVAWCRGPALQDTERGAEGPDEDLVAQLHSRLGRLHLRVLGKAVVMRQQRIIDGAPHPAPRLKSMDEILAAAPATVVHIWRQLEERLGGEGAGAEEALPRRAALADPEHASSSFEAARDTFNEGMTWYKRALERLQLNGWVTDHFGVQLECSAMFRWLKEVEGNIKRKIAMDKERARRLEPILNTINVEAYFGVAQSLRFELAQVYRDMAEVYTSHWAEDAPRPSNKDPGPVPWTVAAAQVCCGHVDTAARYFAEFIANAKEDGLVAALGKAALGCEDRASLEEDLCHVLTARMQRARVLHRGALISLQDKGKELEYVRRALAEAEHVIQLYAKRPIDAFKEEASLTKKFVELLTGKVRHLESEAQRSD